LVAQYTDMPGWATTDTMVETLTIDPAPRAVIVAATAWVRK
jgi:hypothetical protein